MVTVKLYGHLGKLFGKSHVLAVATPIEALRALQANFPSFRANLHKNNTIGYKLIIDKKDKSNPDFLNYPITNEIKIIPVISGAGGGNNQGWIMIVLAIIIAVVAWYNPGSYLTLAQQTNLYLVSASLALNGISALLYKPPDMNNMQTANQVEENKGYHFDGPSNLSRAGSPVPLAYGRIMTGSLLIHAGISTSKG
jgi:predicted phage tail protein